MINVHASAEVGLPGRQVLVVMPFQAVDVSTRLSHCR